MQLFRSQSTALDNGDDRAYRFNIGRLERWLVETGHPAPQASLDRTMRIALTSPSTRPVCIAGVYGQTPLRLRDAIQ